MRKFPAAALATGNFCMALFCQLRVDVVKAEALHGIGKAFAGLTLRAEELDGAGDDVHHLVLRGEDLRQRLAAGSFLAPVAADIDPVAVAVFRKDVEGTLAVAAAAVVAEIFIDIDLAVHDLGDVDGTCLHDLTLLAAVAFGLMQLLGQPPMPILNLWGRGMS